jgi:hypothetical protein
MEISRIVHGWEALFQFAIVASQPTRPPCLRRLLQTGTRERKSWGSVAFEELIQDSSSILTRNSIYLLSGFPEYLLGLVLIVLRGHTQGRKTLADNLIDPSTCETYSIKDRFFGSGASAGSCSSDWLPCVPVLSLRTHWPPANQSRRSAMPFLPGRCSCGRFSRAFCKLIVLEVFYLVIDSIFF